MVTSDGNKFAGHDLLEYVVLSTPALSKDRSYNEKGEACGNTGVNRQAKAKRIAPKWSSRMVLARVVPS